MKNSNSPRFIPRPLAREIALIFGTSAALSMPLALAAPQGGNVVAGQAAIQQNGALTTITQGSQRAAIDWRSFNVGAAETVNFIQPNANAAILNRVVGNDASAIFGRITANGQVLLINPNGILFGRTAQVDVGALTATTSNLSNADFMASRLNFTAPGKAGAAVENQGRITVAEGGFAALVGRQVANSGVITARLGKVALAGGDAFVLDLYGDKLVNLIVDPAAMTRLTDANGQPLAARVDHSGQIVADGGRVQLSVATVKQLVDNLINLSGVVRATSFTHAAGLISLQGDANTRVAVSGTLDASGERGGRVEVTGREVSLQSGAALAATGGNGSIAVGGDWQGRGPLANADQVHVAQGATLDASGGAEGTGGTAVLWSDKNTQFAGRISAAGGSLRGDAGQVEVSSKGQLGFLGEVDVFAQNGRQGSLLLDPLNLTIAATSAGDSQIAADQLRYFLTRGANVNLSATQNVTVDAEVNGLVAGGGGVAGGGLTLTAGNNLAVNQNIVLNDGALNLTATNGTLSQANGTVLYTGTGAANLRGGAGVDLGQVLSGGAVDIRSASGAVSVRNAIVAATPNGSAAATASLVVSGAGNVSVNGALVEGHVQLSSTNASVNLGSAVVQSNTGNVLVNAGTTVASAANNIGLVSGGSTTVDAGGAIDLGVLASTGAASLTSGSGDVTVHQAVRGASGSSTQSLSIQGHGAVVLAGVNAGSGGVSVVTSGNITSQGATSAEGGVVSTGDVILTSTAGQVGTIVAPLRVQSGADLSVEGGAGVTAATVLGVGDVNLSAGAGSVTVSQAIAAQAGAVNASTQARPDSVRVTARDAVDVAGGVAGDGGMTLASSAGTVTLRNSVFSLGVVGVTAQGAVSVLDGAGIVSTAQNVGEAVWLLSHGGSVTLGNGGIRAEGVGSGIALTGSAGVAVNGDVQAHSGMIAIASGSGAVHVLANSSSSDAALNATLDAGQDSTRSIVDIQAAGDIEVGEVVAYNRVQIHSNGGNVTLRRGLGGDAAGTFGGSSVLLNTGYVDHARGYLAQYRPNVGRLMIYAGGSVELNGLNLDGNADASDNAAGLSVTAGRRVVSNNEIAVNKGDIVLAGGTTQATDGVYLGSSVYSRGYDVVNSGVRTKTGYGIRVSGRVLGMFDNTNEMAQLPVNTFLTSWYTSDGVNDPLPHQVRTDAGGFVVDTAGNRARNSDGSYQMLGIRFSQNSGSLADLAVHNVNLSGVIVAGAFQGEQVEAARGVSQAVANVVPQQQIAKIEIANNVANYQDAANTRTLVEANTGAAANRRIEIGTQAVPTTIAGVSNHTPHTAMRITGPAPVLAAPSQAPIISAPAQDGATPATHGIGLKLLSFREAGDTSSQVWGSTVRMINEGDSNNFFFRLTGTGNALSVTDLTTTPPVEGVFTVTAAALATRTYRDSGNDLITEYAQLPAGAGTATHTFLIEDGPNGSELARLQSVVLSGINLSALSTSAPAGSTQVSAWVAAPWRDVGTAGRVRLEPPQLSVAGTASGVQVYGGLYGRDGSTGAALQSGSTLAPSYQVLRTNLTQFVAFQNLQGFNQFSDPRSFQIEGVVADSVSPTRPNMGSVVGTRVFAYDGVIETSNGARTFDGNTGVAIPGLNGIGGFNNSTVGFAGVGAGFGAVVNGTAGSTGVGATSGQGVGGSQIPAGLTGGGTAPPVVVTVEDRSTQDATNPGVAEAGAGNRPGSTDLAFGVRVAAEADLGRGGAVPGSAVNVFKRRYRVATSSNPSVCAPDAVQQTPSTGAAARDCAAK